MLAKDLKVGTKVKWMDSMYDEKFTHGTFVHFGYSVRKCWVKTKKGRARFVNTRMLLKSRQTFQQHWNEHHPSKRSK